MTMTDFFTPCYAKRPLQLRLEYLLLRLLLCVGVWCAGLPSAWAQATQTASDIHLQRSDEGVLLSTTLEFDLPDLVRDALHQGIAMYFVAEAQVLRERWYWSDKTVAHATRYWRLSYQPLTRRWQLNMSSTPFTNAGLGVSLGQSFDDGALALASLQRISGWKIAERSDIDDDDGTRYNVQLRFRLDTAQLPRPLQMGALTPRSGWHLLLSRTQPLAPLLPATAPPSTSSTLPANPP